MPRVRHQPQPHTRQGLAQQDQSTQLRDGRQAVPDTRLRQRRPALWTGESIIDIRKVPGMRKMIVNNIMCPDGYYEGPGRNVTVMYVREAA